MANEMTLREALEAAVVFMERFDTIRHLEPVFAPLDNARAALALTQHDEDGAVDFSSTIAAVNRTIIGLRDGWADENDAEEAIEMLKSLRPPTATAGAVDAEEDAALIEKLSKLLRGVALALNGPEPELTRWSFHDLPEKAAVMAVELDMYKTIFGNKVPDGWESLDLSDPPAEKASAHGPAVSYCAWPKCQDTGGNCKGPCMKPPERFNAATCDQIAAVKLMAEVEKTHTPSLMEKFIANQPVPGTAKQAGAESVEAVAGCLMRAGHERDEAVRMATESMAKILPPGRIEWSEIKPFAVHHFTPDEPSLPDNLAAVSANPVGLSDNLPADPVDWPLPCAVKIGGATFQQGVPLRRLVDGCQALWDLHTRQQPELSAENVGTSTGLAILMAEQARTRAELIQRDVLKDGGTMTLEEYQAKRASMTLDELLMEHQQKPIQVLTGTFTHPPSRCAKCGEVAGDPAKHMHGLKLDAITRQMIHGDISHEEYDRQSKALYEEFAAANLSKSEPKIDTFVQSVDSAKESEREQFEARGRFIGLQLTRCADLPDAYDFGPAQLAWEFWKARGQQAGDALDGERYRFWRDGCVSDDRQPFFNKLGAGLRAIDGEDGYTADQFDAVFDAARASAAKEGE